MQRSASRDELGTQRAYGCPSSVVRRMKLERKRERETAKIQTMQSPAGQGEQFRFHSRAETEREAGILWEIQLGTPVPKKGWGDERKPQRRGHLN